MRDLKNFTDIRRVLKDFIPTPKEYDEARFSLGEMKRLLEFLDNPQKKFKAIHVAGTSGKTSTSYYIAGILKSAGKKVGLTVSPHVDEVNERVQIDLVPLAEAEFCKELSEFLELLDDSDIKPSYFAVIVAFAYWLFAKREVDYAVIEVGMGGLLDATNVDFNPDKICVITDIDLDHTEYLGSTLEAIASQKAGIIQPHNAVFSYKQPNEIMRVIKDVVLNQQAELHEIEAQSDKPPQNLPLFQQSNWYLAYSVVKFLARRDKLVIPETKLAESTMVYIPARMETIKNDDKIIIIDGAHNSQKLGKLFQSIRDKYPAQPIAALAGFVQTSGGRAFAGIKVITGFSDYIILTAFSGEQDTPKESVNPDEIAAYCQQLGYEALEIEPDPVKALQKLLKRPEPILLITGSFYLLNHIRPELLKK